MRSIEGDLIALAKAGHFDVIIHGCNCFCAMGKGIAKSIKAEFPAAFVADCQTPKGVRAKLGSFSSALISDTAHSFEVINAYTQFDFRGAQPNVDYEAIRLAFRAIKQKFGGKGLRIGYPLIGAGLARGDWTLIEVIINEELAGEHHTLVRFKS